MSLLNSGSLRHKMAFIHSIDTPDNKKPIDLIKEDLQTLIFNFEKLNKDINDIKKFIEKSENVKNKKGWFY